MLRHTSTWRGMRFRGLLEDMDSSRSTSFLIPAWRNKCSRTILSWSWLRMDSPTLRRTWNDTVHVFMCSGALWSWLHSHYRLLVSFPHIDRRKAAHIGGLDFLYITKEWIWMFRVGCSWFMGWDSSMNHSLAFIDIPDVRQILGGGLLMSLNVTDQMIFIHRLKKATQPLKTWSTEINITWNVSFITKGGSAFSPQVLKSRIRMTDLVKKEPTPNKRENL